MGGGGGCLSPLGISRRLWGYLGSESNRGKQWAVSTQRWARLVPPGSPGSRLTLPLLVISITAALSQCAVQGLERVTSHSFHPAAGGIP